MGDWFLTLPIPWMAFIIFVGTYLIAACVYLAVVWLARDDRRARAFKAFSPGMLPVLGTIFALLVAFVAVQVKVQTTKDGLPALLMRQATWEKRVLYS